MQQQFWPPALPNLGWGDAIYHEDTRTRDAYVRTLRRTVSSEMRTGKICKHLAENHCAHATCANLAAAPPTPGAMEPIKAHRSLWMDVWLQYRTHKGALVGTAVFLSSSCSR